MKLDFMDDITTRDLTNEYVQRIYGDEAKLSFGRMNYFIGKNGSGKTQTLVSLYTYCKNRRGTSPEESFQLIRASRTNALTGNRSAVGKDAIAERLKQASYEDFYLFLKQAPIIEAEVKFYLKKFFNKNLQIIQEAGNDKMNFKDNELSSGYFSLNSEGGGIKNFVAILTYILSPQVKMLFVDEIEEGLNPQIIDFLISKMGEAMEIYPDKQFFILTHSPSAIYLSKDWVYIFFNRDNLDAAKSKICIFHEFGEEQYRDLPTELDSFRRQVFFADTVILTEADTDYYILNALAKKIGYGGYPLANISFLPVWGVSEMPKYFRFLNQIGKECVCFADANSRETLQSIPEDKKYFFSKDDILMYSKDFVERLKPSSENEKILYEGLFCKNGKKKALAIKREVQDILQNTIEDVKNRYTDVIKILQKIFGSLDKYKFSQNELGPLIDDIRCELQKSDKSDTLDEYIKDNLSKYTRMEHGSDGNTKIALNFKGTMISTNFNVKSGHPIHDPITWTPST